MADTGTYGGGAANPGDSHIPIGKWDPGTGLTWQTRALLYAPVSFSGMSSITAARLYLYTHTADGWHANGSGSKPFVCKRKTADWSETSGGVSSAIDELWGGDGSAYVTGNYVDDGTGDTNLNTDAADGTLQYIDITEIVQAWFAGSANYGVMVSVSAGGDNSAVNAFEAYSRHVSGKKPYIWVDYSTNTAPAAPTNLSPTGSTTVHTGTSFTASGTRSDPDSGDYITAYQIIVYKDDGTTLVQDSGTVTTTGTPTTFSRSMSVGGNGANLFYKWKARTRDKGNVWGPYSALQRVKLNTIPNTPVINTVPTNDLTPTLSGSGSDPDSANGDGMTTVAFEVRRQSDDVLMWDSGNLADTGTTWSQTYAGTALAWSTGYKVRARIQDGNGAFSSYTAYKTWTTSQPVGPTLTPSDPGVKTNDTTPDITIGYTENFTDHELYIYSNVGGTVEVFSDLPVAYTATASKVVTVSPALTNGVTYYMKARVFIQSNSQWSQWAGFVTGQSGDLSAQLYINALPTAPTGLVARNNIDTLPVVRASDGVYIVTTTTPLLTFVFNDPDQLAYGDSASNGDIEVYNNGTGALHWSVSNTTDVNDGGLTYAGTALVNETTYKFRVRFKDNSGSYGAWSDYVLFKPTQSSTLGSVLPSGTVTSPSFTCTWSHGSPGGKTQGSFRVRVTRDSDSVDVFDTGMVTSSAETYDVPGGYLVNGTAYTLTVDAVDTDGV